MVKYIDAHQHLWHVSKNEYSWITPDLSEINRDFSLDEIAADASELGIESAVLIQAADTYADTDFMIQAAKESSYISGVVAWVPLDKPAEASDVLQRYSQDPIIKGIRNLTHDYSNSKYASNDNWILQPQVLETLKEIAHLGLTLDYVAINDAHIHAIAQVAGKIPSLKIVVDHAAKPDIAGHVLHPWKESMAALASNPQIFTKFSGFNTLSSPQWTVDDWRPYFEHIIDVFTPNRVMTGSDWPFSALANGYSTVWRAQQELIATLSIADQEKIARTTAINFYSLEI
ncbi:unannotated protein [freshwater metagenome]|uniref:Unannotated protein n=2 Tax=freshwater metagenome TaxID=449393 RepID=A0A6J7KZV6_9ZZZZ